MKEFKRCNRCIMDNRSDDTIKFDSNGYCNYCTVALSKIGKEYLRGKAAKESYNKDKGR